MMSVHMIGTVNHSFPESLQITEKRFVCRSQVLLQWSELIRDYRIFIKHPHQNHNTQPGVTSLPPRKKEFMRGNDLHINLPKAKHINIMSDSRREHLTGLTLSKNKNKLCRSKNTMLTFNTLITVRITAAKLTTIFYTKISRMFFF